MAVADDGFPVKGREPAAEPAQCLVRRSRAREVEPAGGSRPHPEVGVLVPQPGDQPALAGVDLREPRWPGQVVVDVADPAGLDQHVDRPGPARPVPQFDDPRAPQQEVHARNVGVVHSRRG